MHYPKSNNLRAVTVVEPILIKKNISTIEDDSISFYDFDDLNSDSEDEVNFPDKINDTHQIKNNENKIIIPKIDLKQIEYNKRKFQQKDDEEVSLTRSRTDDDSLVLSKIRRLKQKIKNFKRKVKTKYEKIKKYEQRIPEMEMYLKNNDINYKQNLLKGEFKSERFYLSKIVEE